MKLWLVAGLAILFFAIVILIGVQRAATDSPADPVKATTEPQPGLRPALQPESADSVGRPPFLHLWNPSVPDECSGAAEDTYVYSADLEAYVKQLSDAAVNVLQESTEAEHLLVAALLSLPTNRGTALELLQQARALDASRPLVAIHLLENCGLNRTLCDLPLGLLEREAIDADRANGFTWMHVANSRLRRLDEEGALKALREAVAAADFNGHWVELATAIDRGLAASSDLASRQRLEFALGLVVTKDLSASRMFTQCLSQSEQSPEWLDLCIRLGERLEFDSRTVLNKKLGQDLQKKLYGRVGESRQQALVEKRYEELQEKFDRLVAAAPAQSHAPESALRGYIDTFAAADELTAWEYIGAEVDRLAKETSPLSTCSDPG